MLRIHELKLPLDADMAALQTAVAKLLHLPEKQIAQIKIVKKALDARKKKELQFIYTVDVAIAGTEKAILKKTKNKTIILAPKQRYQAPVLQHAPKVPPVVVGMGPAGFMAALILAEAGCNPIVVERGQKVEEREQKVIAFWQRGQFDAQSNVQFGEGGAGTFSDGKLTTNTKDIRHQKVLEELVAAGAPDAILYEAKPHIGTDILKQMLPKIRRKILALGGNILYATQLTDIFFEQNQQGEKRVVGIVLTDANGNYQIPVQQVILAIGHSARDTFTMLHEKNLPMRQKPFAVGVRIEHLQKTINQQQYGAFAHHPSLGAADYKLFCHLPNGRSVYTFCMCPGGYVVAAASESGGVVTNGMSDSQRAGKNANSAVLVGVNPEDFGSSDPLAGMFFQREMEQKAFLLAGGNYYAPAQLVGDFLQGKDSCGPQSVLPTYKPGVVWTDFAKCLPDFVIESLRFGIPELNQKLPGFACEQAILTGPETRSSSPVRIVRNDTLQCTGGVYPCGEGAGYAGGIMSAATDGIRCAEAVIHQLNAKG